MTPTRSPQTAAETPTVASKGHGAKPAAVRERAVLALLSDRSLEWAAQRSGVNERTLRHWLTEDAAFPD